MTTTASAWSTASGRACWRRSIVVVDTDGSVIYTQLVDAIGTEPDYDAAVAALG